jgi:hypothetical protein
MIKYHLIYENDDFKFNFIMFQQNNHMLLKDLVLERNS